MCFGDREDSEEKKRSMDIEKSLNNDRKNMEHHVKLLLLGAGESGKSTIAKQLKIIHLDGFTENERLGFKSIIFSNIVGSMRVLVEGTKTFGIPLQPENVEIARRLLEEDYFSEGQLNQSIASDIKRLWEDSGIQAMFQRQSELQLNDSAEYYFGELDRISKPDYIPTTQDVLRSRARTTGIIETEFYVGKTHFSLVDVGGQRSERRKWMHCFQDVTAVIFCVGMSEYDKKLFEDEMTNRMHEALKLFKDICNTKWFADTAIILFLNKQDLFEKKIKTVPLTVCFKDYTGDNSFKDAAQYIEDQFLAQNENSKKLIYVHLTCATDTDNITVVFKAVQDIILNKVMNNSII